MSSAPVFIASCSPRKGGNCDFAASLVERTLPVPCSVVRVADAHVRPCSSCGVCDSMPGRCTLDGPTVLPSSTSSPMPPKDGAKALFAAMTLAPVTFIVSPIYYYHIPAQAKAWVDRTQRFWALNGETPAKGRAMACVLIAARQQGEMLFDGAERSLRWMAKTLGMEWLEPLRLYGLEHASALADSVEKQADICSYTARVFGSAAR
ncbi:MAG: NAD(P)H-dependent oxidoreductase [Mailhella sp.]|nr:NAD(P)H-dependent oxidoreductase [Mailhella sp.]